MGKFLIPPGYRHIMRSFLIGLPRNAPGKIRAFDRRIDDEHLILLEMDSRPHHQSRIFVQQTVFHHPHTSSVSKINVTGPSLTDATCISAPNSPCSTEKPFFRHSSMNLS